MNIIILHVYKLVSRIFKNRRRKHTQHVKLDKKNQRVLEQDNRFITAGKNKLLSEPQGFIKSQEESASQQ